MKCSIDTAGTSPYDCGEGSIWDEYPECSDSEAHSYGAAAIHAGGDGCPSRTGRGEGPSGGGRQAGHSSRGQSVGGGASGGDRQTGHSNRGQSVAISLHTFL